MRMAQGRTTQAFMNDGCWHNRGDTLRPAHIDLGVSDNDDVVLLNPPKVKKIQPGSEIWRQIEKRYGCVPVEAEPLENDCP